MSGVKKSRGRQKIEIKKITNESNLQVTFSKRRSGIFKKASELCTLCGADVALVVFSPSGKPFSFGQPSVDAVIQRYLDGHSPPSTMSILEAHRGANVRDLNAQLTQINNHLHSERKRGHGLNLMRKDARARMWWAEPIENMSKAQLYHFKEALEDLKKHVARFIDRAVIQSLANHPVLPQSADRAIFQGIENDQFSTVAYQTLSAPDRAMPTPQGIANHNFFPAGASSAGHRAMLQSIANNPFLPAGASSSADHRAMLQSIANNKFLQATTSPSSNANLVLQPQSLPSPQVFPQQMNQPTMLQNIMHPDGTMMRYPGFDNMGMEGGYGIPDGYFDV